MLDFSIIASMMKDGEKLNVLILAAGLGTRLRPLTNDIPKPLVPVVDESVLAMHARNAQNLGDVTLHANAHYLAEQVVCEGERLGFEKVWVEPEILGTAGPLKRIYNEGYRGGLLVLNGDVYCHFDLKNFLENAQKSGADVALLAIDCPNVNTFRVDENGRLAGVLNRFGSSEGVPATFSGVSWYSDDALSRIADGEFDIREFWKNEIANGRAPFVDMSQMDGCWIDMGSPQGLMKACIKRLQELGVDSWVAEVLSKKLESSFVVLKHSVVQNGVQMPLSGTIENSILFDGAVVNENECVVNEIRGKDFSWTV